MTSRKWLTLGAAALLLSGAPGARGQEPAYSADEIARMLAGGASPRADVAFSAEQLAAMLTPRSSAGPLTRGLKPGTGGPSQPDAQPRAGGVVPDLRINFGFNSAKLQPTARGQLDELGKALRFPELRPLRFAIGGHTDAVGDPSVNERLSRLRAEAVVGYLTSAHDIGPDRLEAIGYGERELLDPARPSSGVNRLVEVRTVR